MLNVFIYEKNTYTKYKPTRPWPYIISLPVDEGRP